MSAFGLFLIKQYLCQRKFSYPPNHLLIDVNKPIVKGIVYFIKNIKDYIAKY